MTGFAEDPQVAYGLPRDSKTFLHWVQDREGRFEFKNGQVVMHAGSTRRHSWLTARFITALSNRLDDMQWAVGSCDIAVEIGDDIRYPDVIVERLVDDGQSVSTTEPVLLVEVLSPSSVARDMTEKFAEYTSLSSLEVYIVASQEEPIVWAWQRSEANRTFPEKPNEISGRDKSIELTTFKFALPLAELFRTISKN